MTLKSFADPADVCVSICHYSQEEESESSLTVCHSEIGKQICQNSKNHLNSLMFWIYRFVWFLTKILTRRLVECVSLVNMNPQLLRLAQRLEKGRQPAWFSDLLASQLNNCLVFFSFV